MATGLYLGARFGAGPRDGLMTALHRITGWSLRLVRGGIEVAVLAAGVLLGGTAGVGTVAYALAIGPLAQFFLRRFSVGGPPGGSPEMDFRERRRPGILRLRSRRMNRYPGPSCADAG
jgi:hypothetical protein